MKRRKVQVEVDGQAFWIAEGDYLLDEAQLREWAEGPPDPREGLVAMDFGEGTVRWAPGVRLTYSVRRASFGESEADYQQAVVAMKEATQDWMSICGCEFAHLAELDTADTVRPNDAVFVVRRVMGGSNTIATAFFPYYERPRRFVALFDGFFTPGLLFEPVGVLRHEMGHVLGFRHEHIRSGAPAACEDESLDHTINLTDYDPQSIMHYFCGGVGSHNLEFTDTDRESARDVYGPPLFRFDLRRP